MSSFRLAVKDNIDVAGLPTTAGLQAWRNRIAQHDAPVVSALKKKGAVVIGKTLMDEAAFGALKGFLDVRYGSRDGSACAEFSWEGYDEKDPACGRGWVVIGTAGRLVGHFYIHNGDDSGFVCQRH